MALITLFEIWSNEGETSAVMSSGSAGQTSDLSSQFAGQFVQNAKNQVQLVGSHFKTPIYVVPFPISCIGTVAFIALIFASSLKKEDVKGSRKAFAAILALLHGMFLLVALAIAPVIIVQFLLMRLPTQSTRPEYGRSDHP